MYEVRNYFVPKSIIIKQSLLFTAPQFKVHFISVTYFQKKTSNLLIKTHHCDAKEECDTRFMGVYIASLTMYGTVHCRLFSTFGQLFLEGFCKGTN